MESNTQYSVRSTQSAPDISVVIPLYNEVESIPDLYAQLTAALEGMGRPYEVIIVDDGSTDGSFEALKRLHEQDPRLRVIRLRRNFGQTPAFTAGFDAAGGRWIVTMDADLQNDPADIPALIAKAEEGYDVVSGWRVQRQDALLSRKIPSRIANWLIAWVTGVHLHDYGCSLKVYHRDVVKNINLYGELHRFVPAVASGLGIRVAEVAVHHRPRERGQSKYSGWRNTVMRTIKVLLDLLTVRFMLSYSTRPIHIFGTLGLLTSGAGFLIGLFLMYVKFILGENIGDRPLLMLAVLLMIVGVQFITMGLLGELIVRTYHEAQDKPIYVVREVLDRRAEEGTREQEPVTPG
jgi:glycosyltransferase involved in cell wall biosynthesis